MMMMMMMMLLLLLLLLLLLFKLASWSPNAVGKSSSYIFVVRLFIQIVMVLLYVVNKTVCVTLPLDPEVIKLFHAHLN